MEVRGSVLISIDEFVKIKHPGQYGAWKKRLSADTLKLIEDAGPQKWYPAKEAVLEPTQHMCDMFYPDAREGAWLSGRHSAEMALKGVFKVFVLVSSPKFLLRRSTRLLPTFYAPTKIEAADSTDKSMLVHLIEIPIKSEILEYRIGGWMEQALEICGCKNLKLNITQSIAKGDAITAYDIKWD